MKPDNSRFVIGYHIRKADFKDSVQEKSLYFLHVLVFFFFAFVLQVMRGFACIGRPDKQNVVKYK